MNVRPASGAPYPSPRGAGRHPSPGPFETHPCRSGPQAEGPGEFPALEEHRAAQVPRHGRATQTPRSVPTGWARGSDDDGTDLVLARGQVRQPVHAPAPLGRPGARERGRGRPAVGSRDRRALRQATGLFVCEWDIGVELAKGCGLVPLPARTDSARACDPWSAVDIEEHVGYVMARLEEMGL